MAPPSREAPKRFPVAFSFSGVYRDKVREIAELLEQRLGWGMVFFDEWFGVDLVGAAADLQLQENYECAELVVVCVSGEYARSGFTSAEWERIRARMNRLLAAQDSTERLRILPLRVGDGDLPGLLETAIELRLEDVTPKFIADMMVQRLKKLSSTSARTRVFLAETIPEFDEDGDTVTRKRLRRYLEDTCECTLCPDDGNGHPTSFVPHSSADREELLRQELPKCLAFVQLISGEEKAAGGYPKFQYDLAKEKKLNMLRFRGNIPLGNMSASYRGFVEENGSLTGQFEDFKQHLAQSLQQLRNERILQIREWQGVGRPNNLPLGGGGGGVDDQQPLVRVSIKAQNGQQLWTTIFRYLFEQQQIRLQDLDEGETFRGLQQIDPSDGFLILCDEKAQREKDASPRKELNECLLIQAEISRVSGRNDIIPPVAVVFLPPPEPAWELLLKAMPRKLHRVLNDRLQLDLPRYLTEVRNVKASRE